MLNRVLEHFLYVLEWKDYWRIFPILYIKIKACFQSSKDPTERSLWTQRCVQRWFRWVQQAGKQMSL